MYWTNITVAFFNFIALDSPKHRVDDPRLLAPHSTAQSAVARALFEDAARFCRTGGGHMADFSGGRQRLQTLLGSLSPSYGMGWGKDFEHLQSTHAEEVDLTRIAVPEQAGVLDPLEVHTISASRLHTLSDLNSIVFEPEFWPCPLPRPCHRISRDNETQLIRTCLTNRMGVLVEEGDVPRDRTSRVVAAG
jgi:hypothetical protein